MLDKLSESLAIKIVTVMHALLFTSKVIFWFLSWSVAVISDWFHSWVDVLTTLAIWFATKISKKDADEKYNFWYWKAQAIAAFFVAFMAWISWLEIWKYWFDKLFNPTPLENEIQLIFIMAWAVLFSWAISFLMTYIWKKNSNSAMIASWKETIWDVLLSFSTLIWIFFIYFFDIHWLDPLLAIFIWIMILKIAYEIVVENINILMWSRASNDQLLIIQNLIFDKFPIVKALHDIHTQRISENEIYLVIHCEVNEKEAEWMNFKQVHDLEEEIQFALEELDFVHQAVIHLDYHNDAKLNRVIGRK